MLFIDASKEFTADKTQNVMSEVHIAKVVETYAKRDEIDKFSHRASLKEIKENDLNLNIPRYVDTFIPEDVVDIRILQKDIDRLESELLDVRTKMAGYLKELGVDA